jgi:hypothetical protein
MNKQKLKVKAGDVELLERYINAVERLEELQNKLVIPNRDDIETAEKYLETLIAICEYNTPTESDQETAEKYLETLIAICEYNTPTESDQETAEKYLETLIAIDENK